MSDDQIDKKRFSMTSPDGYYVSSTINPTVREDVPNHINSAVFLRVSGGGGNSAVAVSSQDARNLAAALIDQADEFDRLLEESRPKLPTEPGLYIRGGVRKDIQSYYVFKLNGRGEWSIIGNGLAPGGMEYIQKIFERFGFSKLGVAE